MKISYGLGAFALVVVLICGSKTHVIGSDGGMAPFDAGQDDAGQDDAGHTDAGEIDAGVTPRGRAGRDDARARCE